jgi:NAD(P)-dependent dehydrogenase (short-subunit alcohol dehydrogenase family)
VTGAARGIGAAIADAFERAGAVVVRVDMHGSDGILACDVTDEKALALLFDEVQAGGALHDIVHAAGIAIVGAVAETSVDDFRHVIDVNLTGSFLVARQAAQRLSVGGNLVFIASQGGLKGGALWGAYCASKGGVLRLADCLAEELAPRGIRVNSISPGSVDTAMTASTMAEVARRSASTLEAVRSEHESSIPMRRFAHPEEIGRTAVALCSDLFSYVNGANIVVDGGELSR